MAYLGNTTLTITKDTYLGNAREGLANNSLVGNVLLANNITTRELSDNSVSTNNIINSAVTEVKIQNSAVTEVKIQNSAVTEVKIQDRAVTANKIANTAVAVGTYGGKDNNLSNKIPVITIDQQGRITSAANVSVEDSFPHPFLFLP
jgi:hypothetical protein